MLQGLIQRTCLVAFNTAHTILVRQKHAFDRAVLKPKVRCHFPKPREVKRINVHGWDTRMSTPEGRRVLMRRILKGRHNISH
ncbi:39S ribosomal protein L34, mitochondrial [Drosophila pseudoobscura]|uniref:Large ribosomal subunit protein bL34m n=1 Tax=Drosophila pseudoobscura pseudoobscura TaxID=46245 RepID=A0A6I8V638_DROPS|nr:39S ribosomal protein L34, mitochondrial [Drosophila pseudoobscura]